MALVRLVVGVDGHGAELDVDEVRQLAISLQVGVQAAYPHLLHPAPGLAAHLPHHLGYPLRERPPLLRPLSEYIC